MRFSMALLTAMALVEVAMADAPAKPAETLRVRGAGKPASTTYRVARMRDNPTIDGDWDKAAWKNVKPLVLEYYMGDEPKHQPRVQAKAAYDDDYLYLIWRVEDRYVRAARTEHQQDVCKDSCVEFFFTPGGDPAVNGYFNLEMNCGGVMLFGAHVPAGKEGKFSPQDLNKIVSAGTLKAPIANEIARPTVWTREYKIPFSILEKQGKVQRPRPGVTWRANFYKCADETSHPHWLTWAPVTWPTPSFHRPQFFGTLAFE